MSLTRKFRRWLDHKLKDGVYELRNGEIICGRGRRPEHRLKIEEIVSWQIHPEMGFDMVIIGLKNNQEICWIDKYDDLIAILQNVAVDKEIPEKN